VGRLERELDKERSQSHAKATGLQRRLEEALQRAAEAAKAAEEQRLVLAAMQRDAEADRADAARRERGLRGELEQAQVRPH
jgi:hypothetical protein